MKIHKPWLAIGLAAGLLMALFAGCGAPTLAPTPVQPSPTSPPPAATLAPTATASLASTPLPPTLTPTATATASHTPTESPTATVTSSVTPTATLAERTGRTGSGLPAPSGEGVKIYFIQQDSSGGGGCNDRAVAVGSGVAKDGDIAEDVAAGLEALFSAKWEYSGALYNPLSRSSIRVKQVEYNDSGGLIQVWLSGDYNPSGDECDNTRVKAQIWSTIRQFRGVERTNIYLNNVPFGDRLSNDK